MKRFSLALAIACCAMLMAAQNVSAQDGPGSNVRYASFSSMQDMIDRIDSLEASLASYSSDGEFVDGGGKGGCSTCGSAGGCDCFCANACGIYVGVEAVYARPHFEDEVDVDDNGSGYDWEISARFIGGIRNANGFGGRVRYWRWDHRSNVNSSSVPPWDDPFRLDVQALDLELTQMVCWGPVNATFFGGTRYGRVWHKDNDNEGMTFEGWGPSIGTELLISINCTNLALVGNLRYSALFGHSRFDEFDRADDDFVTGVDTQLGVQYSRCMGHGTLLIRGLVEAQVWAGATDNPSDDLDDSSSTDEDLAFVGFTFGVEYLW